MKRVIIGSILLIVIAITGTLFFTTNINDLILQTIEEEGSQVLGVSVKVTTVETDLKHGFAKIHGLTVANPTDYKEPFALQITNLDTSVDYQRKEIDEILINKPIITAEFNKLKNNFQALLENLPRAKSQPVNKNDAEDTVSIKAIKVTQAQINLLSENLVLGQQTIPINDFVMHDIEGSPKEITRQIMAHLTHHIASIIQDYVEQRPEHKMTQQIKNKANNSLNEKVDKKLRSKLRELRFYLG